MVKGGRSKDAAVAGLLSKTDSSKKKQQDEEARDEDELDGEESQLPDDLASCFNVTIHTTRYGRTTAIPLHQRLVLLKLAG